MTITNVSHAKAQLSALIARVEAGEEVIIGKAGKPIVKLVPFDRMLVAQAACEGLTIVTRDLTIPGYGTRTLQA